MARRQLGDVIEQERYFETVPVIEEDEGTRELGEQYPYIISGGTNTEKYYFTHINDTTNYKFIIKPEYFADESNYIEAFPKRIHKIMSSNVDAKIFCVFDWDVIFGNEKKLRKHKGFEKQFQIEISNGHLIMCPSMPSIEYWFLLHFEDYKSILKNYRKVSSRLSSYKSYFLDPSKRLKKLLKMEKYLKNPAWVIALCADGKLEIAIKRAKDNINAAIAANDLENQSFSFVYKVFTEYR